MKVFAYYLPQFHCIPENDEWWGKGFTEWTNVKSATPLYKGHIQPKHPLNDNYYSLDNVETLKWQSELLDKYKVDGLIFYHYYFTGKKLLEKPAEMLLKNKDIGINFFFCWANHSWFRSWEGSKKLLLEQKYGAEKEWEEHFNYLLPFFKDDRYQKKDNKPIFMIFKSIFEEKKEMFEYFNKKCIENGFDGLCLIETIEMHKTKMIDDYSKNSTADCTEYIHLREPGMTIVNYWSQIINFPKRVINKALKMMKFLIGERLTRYDGNQFFKLMSKKYSSNKKIIRCLVFEWDNTPRHKERGYVISPPDKKVAFKYMNLLKEDDFVFVNAWNEWCEGMMLEPTEEHGYKYLEWIKEWKEQNNT